MSEDAQIRNLIRALASAMRGSLWARYGRCLAKRKRLWWQCKKWERRGSCRRQLMKTIHRKAEEAAKELPF